MNEPLTQDDMAALQRDNQDLRIENARLRNDVRYWKSVADHVRAYMREQGIQPHEEITHA